MLITQAVEFFAENGFDASTHQLADALGVTQPLIYRYFATKEDLLEAVYASLLEGHFKAEWSDLIADRSRPLAARLLEFYQIYGRITQSRSWLRLYLYAGLKSLDLNPRFLALIEQNIINRIAVEARHDLGLPSPEALPVSAVEREVVWNMHAGLFYYGIRKEVFSTTELGDFDEMLDRVIRVFIAGYPAIFRQPVTG